MKAACEDGHRHLTILSNVLSGFGIVGQVRMEHAYNVVRTRYCDRLIDGGKTRNEEYGFGCHNLGPQQFLQASQIGTISE